MAGATLEIEFRPGRVVAAIAELQARMRDPQPLLRTIGVLLVRNTQDRFDDEVSPDGAAWAPLSPGYLPHKRGAGILRAAAMRGGLQGSITSRVEGGNVVVGSGKVYAAVHQFGAEIVAKNPSGKLTLRDWRGQAWGRAESVTIPARPYLGLSSFDEATILEATEDYLDAALRRR